jgi:predicted XRE-type DNA-binding protein
MQIAGDVKKDTGLKFKAACTLNELTLGEGLEQAILLWLEQDELKKIPITS